MTLGIIISMMQSCGLEKWENEMFPAPKREPVSSVGFWYYQTITSEGIEEIVYNIREDNNVLMYISKKSENGNKPESYSEQNKCYFDRSEGFVVFCTANESQEREWTWELFKVLELDERTLSIAPVTDNGFHLYGPFNGVDCQGIIDCYRERPWDDSRIMTFKRISQNEFINWWNSVS